MQFEVRLLFSIVALNIFFAKINILKANSDSGIDCIDKYSQSIVLMIEQGGESKDISELRRVRALIRESYRKIPILGSNEENEEDEQEVRSAFRMRKDREKKNAQLDLEQLAKDSGYSLEETARILRDSTRYAGPVLCTKNELFQNLPSISEIERAMRTHWLKRQIRKDQRYQLVSKWRKRFDQYEGQFLLGMEVEVEFSGLENAPLLKYLDLDYIYKIWNKNFPEEVDSKPPNKHRDLVRDLVRFAKLIKSRKIKDDGKTLRVFPLKTVGTPLYFHNINMFWDDGAIEFNHEKPYKNPADMLESLYIISEGSLFEKEIFEPRFQFEKTISRTNFHISTQKNRSEIDDSKQYSNEVNLKKQDIRGICYEFNKLLALRMVKRGLENQERFGVNDFSPFQLYKKHDISRYRSGYINLKGILRFAPSDEFNRVEVRRHYTGIDQEIRDYIGFFNMGEHSAVAQMRREMQQILGDQRVSNHIFEFEPLNLLNFRHVMDHAVLHSYLEQLNREDYKFALHIIEMDHDEERAKLGELLASLPLTNSNTWYINDPIKVCDPVDALVERYGKKYTQGYHARRLCYNDNTSTALYFTDYYRLKDLFKKSVKNLPNDKRHRYI
ncbi:MAG: hypothetical protein AB8G05_03585 [Oligoflexales bacterium]